MSAHFAYPGYTPPQKLKFILELRAEDTNGHGMSSHDNIYTAHWLGAEDTINPFVQRMILESSFWSIESFPNDMANKWLQKCFVNYAYMYLHDTSDESKERPDTTDKTKGPKNASPRECAYWMNYVVKSTGGKPDVAQKVFKLAREGKYTDAVWKQLTGKSGKQLWDEMK